MIQVTELQKILNQFSVTTNSTNRKKHLQWVFDDYRKFPKYLDTLNMCCNHSKIWTMWLYHRVSSPNNADGMANCVDPDQTAPLEEQSDQGLHCLPRHICPTT